MRFANCMSNEDFNLCIALWYKKHSDMKISDAFKVIIKEKNIKIDRGLSLREARINQRVLEAIVEEDIERVNSIINEALREDCQ